MIVWVVFSLCRCCGTRLIINEEADFFRRERRKDRRGESLHYCSDSYDVKPPMGQVEVRPCGFQLLPNIFILCSLVPMGSLSPVP